MDCNSKEEGAKVSLYLRSVVSDIDLRAHIASRLSPRRTVASNTCTGNYLQEVIYFTGS